MDRVQITVSISIIDNQSIFTSDVVEIVTFVDRDKVSSLPYIDTFVIELTHNCNMRCSYCCYSGEYRNSRKHGDESLNSAKIDDIVRFIIQNAKANNITVCFYGGEPLLEFCNIVQIVDKLKNCSLVIKYTINTNGVLLKGVIAAYLYEHDFYIYVSLDGCKAIHDNNRRSVEGASTYEVIYKNLLMLESISNDYFVNRIGILITVSSTRDILQISKEWDNDNLLMNISPTQIGVVADNFSKGVKKLSFNEKIAEYYSLLDAYRANPYSIILKKFFDDYTMNIRKRDISKMPSTNIPSTCLPNNHKCFIDIDGKVGVCEKMCDIYRIGDIHSGYDFEKINTMIAQMSLIRKKHCSQCSYVRVCESCLLSLDLDESELNTFCHNERIHNKIAFIMLCELAESNLL